MDVEIYNIASDMKVEEMLDVGPQMIGLVGMVTKTKQRKQIKKEFGLHRLVFMSVNEIMDVLSTNPKKAKDIYYSN